MEETELWELLISLSAKKISLAETHDRILRLFNVVEQSELCNCDAPLIRTSESGGEYCAICEQDLE